CFNVISYFGNNRNTFSSCYIGYICSKHECGYNIIRDPSESKVLPPFI
ncbi:hypothetical protein X975_17281, partial [Stegodyphus mimosarum]